MKTQNINRSMLAVILLMLTASLNATAAGRNPNPGIIPPGGTYRGLTYGEWGALWWQTIFAIPIVNGDHPYFSGGVIGESKGVVLLAATGGGASIEVTVPTGASLFFPVLNAECSVLEPDPFHGDNEAELRACANGHLDQTSGMAVTIDGVPVNSVGDYRVESPLFEFGPLPADNIFGAPAGATSLAVDAGVYMLLAPLNPGQHSIHVTGTFDAFGFTIDTTYYITVK